MLADEDLTRQRELRNEQRPATSGTLPRWQPTLSIHQLSDRLGLPSATLRDWEKRDGYPRPVSAAGEHREYPIRTLLTLLESAGEAWSSGEWNVAQKHFATQLLRLRLSRLIRGDRTAGPDRPR